ncbi:MAG: DUF4115 domain-containing protein [Magnetococcales bacterium]|nr:DUF4115 domain-containing protein [Magnetococcales bacterium]
MNVFKKGLRSRSTRSHQVREESFATADNPAVELTRPSAPSALQVGAFLRQARERQGLTIGEIARRTRIRDVYLLALEAGEVEKLPGMTFVAGFLRLYAETLELSDRTLIERYLESSENEGTLSTRFVPAPTTSRHRPSVVLVLGGVLGLLMLYYVYEHYIAPFSASLKPPQLPATQPMRADSLPPGSQRTHADQPDPVLHDGNEKDNFAEDMLARFFEQPNGGDDNEEEEGEAPAAGSPASKGGGTMTARLGQAVESPRGGTEGTSGGPVQRLKEWFTRLFHFASGEPAVGESRSVTLQSPATSAPAAPPPVVAAPPPPVPPPSKVNEAAAGKNAVTAGKTPSEVATLKTAPQELFKTEELNKPSRSEPAKKSEPPKGMELLKIPEAIKPAETTKAAEAAKAVEVSKTPAASKVVEVIKPPEPPKAVEGVKPSEPPKAVEGVKPPEPPKAVEAPKAAEAPRKVAVKESGDPATILKNRYQEEVKGAADLQAESEQSVSLLASEMVWVQIQDEKGAVLKDMVMQPNRIFRVPAGGRFIATLGNAAAVKVRVGQRELPYLGAAGAEVSGVDLTPEALLRRAKP